MLADVSMLADTPVNVITGHIIGAAIEVHRGCPAGLLINFNVARLIDGVTRLINPTTCGR